MKDRDILLLKDQTDLLEQYSRRNCVRIGPVPEMSTKSTGKIIQTMVTSINMTLPDNAIDKNHCMGRVTSGTATE